MYLFGVSPDKSLASKLSEFTGGFRGDRAPARTPCATPETGVLPGIEGGQFKSL
jgi:hypothetical protein